LTDILAENNAEYNIRITSEPSNTLDDVVLDNVTATGASMTNVLIKNSTVSGNNFGILMNADDAVATLSGVSITGSEIRNNVIGIQTSDYAATGNAANNNNIVGNGTGAINLDPNDSFDALSNFWGCAGGPGVGGCDTVSANVVYTPWLGEEIVDEVPALDWRGSMLFTAILGLHALYHLRRRVVRA
jgi:hypothetical protein